VHNSKHTVNTKAVIPRHNKAAVHWYWCL